MAGHDEINGPNGAVTNGRSDGKLAVEDLPEVADDEAGQNGQPPHSAHAEVAVLGSVLKRGLAIADVLPFLKPHHFYEAKHRHIYAAMVALFERAVPIGYHTLGGALKRTGAYE